MKNLIDCFLVCQTLPPLQTLIPSLTPQNNTQIMAATPQMKKSNARYAENVHHRGNVKPSLKKEEVKVDKQPTYIPYLVGFFAVVIVGSALFDAITRL
ncbi:hypothetical protein BASA81_016944 [Batrachochytrium salamandrivorans]|nr:hypothetical protein BASA81_016944 [Batrachochytrium salamandrivorans]